MAEGAQKFGLAGILEVVAKFLTPIVLFGVGTYYTCSQDAIDREQKVLDRCIGLTKDLASGGPTQQKMALAFISEQCMQHSHAVEGVLAVTLPEVVQTAAKSADPEVAEAAKEVAIKLSANTNLAEDVKHAVSAIPRAIYIHIPDEARRSDADEIKRRLDLTLKRESSPYSIEGIENVGTDRSPSATQVRYFRDEDADAARHIAEQLVRFGIPDAKESRTGGKARPFQLEIWFGRSPIRRFAAAAVQPTP
jgi:hypothetical protein